MTLLHRLATAAGLQIDWEDATGKPQRVSDDSLRYVLAALGYSAENEAEIEECLERCRVDAATARFVSADIGQPIALPSDAARSHKAELVLENGSSHRVPIERTEQGPRIPPVDIVGYHRLLIDGEELRLAVAPSQCFTVADAAPGRRLWGPAVQVPSLLTHEHRAFGDFGALAESARDFAARGADALAISPAHALFPADPGRFGPYAPSSRLFLNILLGDPGLIGCPLGPEDAPELIEWEHAIPARIAALRAAFTARSDGVQQALAEYRRVAGKALERHATFDALHAHFLPSGAYGWQGWPKEYHDPESDAVTRFAAQHDEEVGFYLFAQWLAKTSLDAAQRAARDAGMAIGLISDLAVGMDGGGSHAWSRRGDLLTGLSVGAPPDPLGPHGQDWGITNFSPAALKRTGFEPFVATLRAALDHSGGIRIDHALGLQRLWVIPHGSHSSEGAYLNYPLHDLLRILAIESQRARAIVIGEDLGTVPEGLRPQLQAREILGMRVLWFEREENGDFRAPSEWDRQAVSMTSTHDLPTVAGWWRGRDIDWTWHLGRDTTAPSEAASRLSREDERKRLWHAFRASGATSEDIPTPEDTAPVADAALVQVGSTPSELAIVPIEDVLGLVEQPNLPGTRDEHPNWRRRMPAPTGDMLGHPEVAARLRRLDESRK